MARNKEVWNIESVKELEKLGGQRKGSCGVLSDVREVSSSRSRRLSMLLMAMRKLSLGDGSKLTKKGTKCRGDDVFEFRVVRNRKILNVTETNSAMF